MVVSNLRTPTSFNNGHCTTCCNHRVADQALSHAHTSTSTGGTTFPFDWVCKYVHANDGVPNLLAQQTVSNRISSVIDCLYYNIKPLPPPPRKS